ncbi:MAG: carboxypeptidase-like regulatory domain-containing protein, partial [Candidatus Cloacimonetes bacterium]|nr:carboxypeptidase-like regulatory domain-containing protein [Candidatus Cloacimonadota bacterium]
SNPLQNAIVTATNNIGGGGSAVTNQEGDYQINNLVPGNYTITVTRNNYQNTIVSNISIPGNQNILKNISMSPLTGELAITCNPTGSTISIENTLTGAVSNYTTTSQLTEIQGIVPQTPLIITASKSNYYPQTQSITIPANSSQSLSFTLIQAIGSIAGKVTDQPNGAGDGLANVQINAVSLNGGFSGSATTDASGNFIINNLQTENTYNIVAQLSNYNQSSELLIELPNSLPIQNQYITMLPNNLSMSGTVKNQLGNPLAAIPIKAVSENIIIQASTNSAGQFTLTGLSPNKTYQIMTNKVQPGWDNVSVSQELVVSNITGINLIMPVHISNLSGVVKDQNTQNPIAGALITTYNSNSGLTRSTVTQTDGSYMINNLYDGTIKITASKDSFKPDSLLNIQIGYNANITQNISLQYSQPISVSGIVKDTSNRLQANVQVNISGGSMNLSATTNDDGEYVFANVLPYKSNILIGTNLDPITHDNASLAFNTENSDIELEPLIIDIHNASLSGAVANQSGEFLNNALVVLKRLSDSEEFVVTSSSNGQFSFLNLYEGQYELQITRAGYQAYTNDNISLSDGESLVLPITLQMLQGSVAGLVHNYLGQPLKNAKVKLTNINNQSQNYEVLSGNDGSFVFEATDNTAYQLHVTKTGYINYEHSNALAIDSVSVNVELSGIPNSVLGTALYQNNPVANGSVRAVNIQGDTYITSTNDYGDYVISNIIGYHKVWASSDQLVSNQQEINIAAGQYVITDFNLMQSANIPGTVTYNNQGIAGASIIATNINTGRVFTTSTNTSGNFTLTGLTGATYYIQVIKEGYSVNENFPTVQVGAGETSEPLEFTLTYTENSISGSAINAETMEGISAVSIELKQNNEVINSTNTNNSGSFIFANISDGEYTLSANHGAYESAGDMDVSVLDGISDPTQIDFLLTPKSKVIYGVVTNTKLNPLSNAIVYATIGDDSYQGITNANGQYSISVPAFGSYSVFATKQYFSNSSIVSIDLTENNPTAQLSFQLKQLPASLSGSITITDQTLEPYTIEQPDQLTISIYTPEADPIIENYYDSGDYLIDNINLLIDNFSVILEIVAKYNDDTFKKVQAIDLIPGENIVFDHNFSYIPNSVSLGGYIKMELSDGSIVLPTSSKLTISNSSTIIDSVFTSNSGYYQFNSLSESDFPINMQISSIYEFEEFNEEIDNILWTGEDIELNYNFEYKLCEYKLTVINHLDEPFKFTNVRIFGESLMQPINLITDNTGQVSTDAILHTGEYSVKITPPETGSLTYLAPQSYSVIFEKLGTIEDIKILPLAFDTNQITPVASNENIEVKIIKSASYNEDVILYYKNLNNVWGSSIMALGANSDELVAAIPAQNRSGNVKFYFVSESEVNGLTYTNQSVPAYWLVTTAGIISPVTSTITPNTAHITFNQKLNFTADVYDELENALNDVIDDNGIVEWSLADSTLGELIPIDNDKRSIQYCSPEHADNYSHNTIKARIKLNDVTINLSAPITIKEMKLAEISIDGNDEVNNSILNNYYRIIAKSDSGEVMTISPTIKEISSNQGNITLSANLIKLSPNPNYIGNISLNVEAEDPNDEELVVKGEKMINVFKLITPNTPADTLDTGLGCMLYLPTNMLSSGSANIYLNQIQVSPVQQYGTEYDVEGQVFHALSSGNPNFISRPSIAFNTRNEDDISLKTIANWDFDKMQWVHLPSHIRRANTSIYLDEMPNWGQYALLSPSQSLGLYDLKLLPNPFTPFDQIGSNKGLQISFKIASKATRYPKLTCKIYNLNGTLVRTITNQSAFLKGQYDIGESTSLYWDGKTDDNRMARNGRYVVHLIVEDATDRKEYVKSVVLIK